MKLNLGSMKSYAVAIVAGLLLLGGYSQRSEAAACGDGTWDALADATTNNAGFTCEIGDKTFSGFLVAGDLDGNDIKYTSIDGIDGFWGFRFQMNLVAAGDSEFGPQFADVALGYKVACTDTTTKCIDSIHADIVGSFLNSEGGTGAGGFWSMGESYIGATVQGVINLGQPGGLISDSKDFAPQSSLSITKDLLVGCANIGTGEFAEPDPLCASSISFLRNTVDQVDVTSSGPGASSGEPSSSGNGVPEPASLSLLAAGLMGLGLYRRRRNRV